MPTWLPPSHIWFVMDDYGINHLVGAIKLRVQEHGGEVRKLDALAEAQRVANESQYLADRNAMLHERTVGRPYAEAGAIDETLRRIVEKVAELRAQTGMPLEGGAQGQHVVMTDRRIPLVAEWQQKFFGNVEQDAHFWVREFSGPIALPGERLMYVHSPKMLREYQFTTDITLTRELCWPLGKERIPANEFPDRIVKMFLDLYLQANEGKGRDAAKRMRR